MLPEHQLNALHELTRYLAAKPVMPSALANSKNKAFMRETLSNMESTDTSFGEATATMPHLNRPDAKDYLRSIDNDLIEQVKITRECAESWFQNGEHPAPYYPWRITVILRKIKAFDLERDFLAAYCKHFYNTLGSRDAKIAERAVKIRAYNL